MTKDERDLERIRIFVGHWTALREVHHSVATAGGRGSQSSSDRGGLNGTRIALHAGGSVGRRATKVSRIPLLNESSGGRGGVVRRGGGSGHHLFGHWGHIGVGVLTKL